MSTNTDAELVPPPEGDVNLIETDYTIGQDNITPKIGPLDLDIHNPVFLVSASVIVLFTAIALIFGEAAGTAFTSLRGWLTVNFDWFFLLAGNVFVLLCLVLIVTPLGSVRLGGKEATPDYSYVGWFSMLFAAGMGIGLMFYGVSEPISHYEAALGGVTLSEGGVRTDWAPLGAAAGNAEAARDLGMAATIFHWGLHPWAIYAVVALALALFTYNKGLPLSVRSMFYPVFGERIWGWPGHVIDTLAVFATLFGLATSLGIGAEQAAAGLAYLFGEGDAAQGTQTFLGFPYGNEDAADNSAALLVVLIGVITAFALISVLRGLDGGVKVLSEINMGLAALLLLFVVAVGAPIAVLTGFFDNLLAYATYILPLSNPFGREDANFSQGWTAFYWAWWISWSPFVGMFIARVSRGRTVREFLVCVLLIPSLVSVLWMTAFGGTAIELIQGGAESIGAAPLELKLFEMLAELPLAAITSVAGIVLVIVFFVTSSDSGSLVIDTITAGGKVNAPVSQRVFWCTFEGLVAIALLMAGGLAALQAMAVSTGFPFAIVLLLACYSIVRGLMTEPR